MFDADSTYLSWTEVDPHTHRFDQDEARQIVLALVAGGAVDSGEVHPITSALQHQFGKWSCGWRSSPVVISRWREFDLTPEEITGHIVRDLVTYREWLEECARSFEQLGMKPNNFKESFEQAAVFIIKLVWSHIGPCEGWSHGCPQPLNWYLQFWGLDIFCAQDLIANIIDKHFFEDEKPADELIMQTARDIVTQVAESLDGFPS